METILKLKPTVAERFYPTLPVNEDAFEGETRNEEECHREQRNERMNVNKENECKQIEWKEPLIERTPWINADLKVKS